MSAYLRISVGSHRFLLDREAVSQVDTIEAMTSPLPLHSRAPRPTLYVDARRLLGEPASELPANRNLVRLFPTPGGLECVVVVDKMERLDTLDAEDFLPLPRGAGAHVGRFVDAVLVEGGGRQLLMRLRARGGTEGGQRDFAVARALRRAAVTLRDIGFMMEGMA